MGNVEYEQTTRVEETVGGSAAGRPTADKVEQLPQHIHEEKLAKIDADRQVRIERVKADDRDHRRVAVATVVVIVCVLALLFGLVGACANNANRCIDNGGEWDGGDLSCETSR